MKSYRRIALVLWVLVLAGMAKEPIEAMGEALAFSKALINKDAKAMKALVVKADAAQTEAVAENANFGQGLPDILTLQNDGHTIKAMVKFPNGITLPLRLVKEDGAWRVAITDPSAADVPKEVRRTQDDKMENDLEALRAQLRRYQTMNHFFPTTAQGLRALVERPAGEPVPRDWRLLFKELPRDPWGQPYQYRQPGKREKQEGFDVFSMGPDQLPGTADDVGNW